MGWRESGDLRIPEWLSWWLSTDSVVRKNAFCPMDLTEKLIKSMLELMTDTSWLAAVLLEVISYVISVWFLSPDPLFNMYSVLCQEKVSVFGVNCTSMY